jgi:hypothetical protein
MLGCKIQAAINHLSSADALTLNPTCWPLSLSSYLFIVQAKILVSN